MQVFVLVCLAVLSQHGAAAEWRHLRVREGAKETGYSLNSSMAPWITTWNTHCPTFPCMTFARCTLGMQWVESAPLDGQLNVLTPPSAGTDGEEPWAERGYCPQVRNIPWA